MKQIMVVGAGAVGGYFGAQLAKSNPNVSFLLRSRTLEAVKQRGLTIRSAKGTLTVHPPAASDPRQLATPDLDGAPLPDGKGGPSRLVTPGLGDLCANLKGVGRIEQSCRPRWRGARDVKPLGPLTGGNWR